MPCDPACTDCICVNGYLLCGCGTGTVGGNVLALLGFYVAFVFVGYIYLRCLYKERR